MKKFALLALVFSLSVSQASAETYKDHLALHQLVLEIRKPETPPHIFRQSLEKIGEYMGLEVINELQRKEVEIETCTGGRAKHQFLNEDLVLVTVLRAGLPLCLGVQKVFPHAPVGFIGMSRNEETLKAKTEYIALPTLKDKCVIVIDTMIATAGSMLDSIKIVKQRGANKIIVVGAIASKAGLERIAAYDPTISVYAAAVDPSLNEHGYIIPGLGDAGDRCYGTKL